MDALEVIKNWVKKDSEVLDLGCGKGEILKILSEELNTTSLGIEIDQEKELQKLEDIEINKQLNQFSRIYFDKSRINFSINEK